MISAIELKNFKCFKNERIEFSSLTLLTGLNGSGKSTVVQALLLLRQSFYENVLAKGISLNGDLINIGTGRDLFYERAEGPEEISITIDFEDELVNKWVFEHQKESNFLHTILTEYEKEIGAVSLFTDHFEYLCAERISPRNTFPKSNHIVAEHKHIGIHGEYTPYFLHLYGRKPIININAKYEEIDEVDLINQTKAWLNIISPGVKFETSEYAQADLIGMQYGFIDVDVSNLYRPINVGFGITYALPIIVALLKAEKDSIVIIENPEAHLHPKGQRKMGELIARVASGGVQVIIETHSDHILNGIRLAVKGKIIKSNDVKLNHLEKTIKGNQVIRQVISPNIKDDGRLDTWPKGFFDEWDKALDELF